MEDPITNRAERLVQGYGLIEVNFDRCVTALTVKGECLLPGGVSEYPLARRTDCAAEAIEFLSILTVPATRLALFAASDNWTVLLTNHCNGSDYADYGFLVSRRLQTRTVRVVDRPGRVWRRGVLREVLCYEARIFTVFGPDGRETKSIYCVDDGGKWSFGSLGEPLAVEASFRYSAKKKKDRFTSENLRELLRSSHMPVITRESLLNARDLALIQEPGRPARQSTPEQEDDPAFGYYQRGLGWVPHIQTHAESVVHDLERAVEIDPRYEPRVRQYLEQARKVLRKFW
jgi:hypothetical protein